LKSGLIDGIGTLTEVLTKKYPNAKIEFPMGRNLRQRLYSFSPL
jgi:ClpP class serine protease